MIFRSFNIIVISIKYGISKIKKNDRWLIIFTVTVPEYVGNVDRLTLSVPMLVHDLVG